MKMVLALLLELMLLTPLVGISYATPIVQPTQSGGDANSCAGLSPNNPNYFTLGCAGAAHQNGNDNPPHHSCATGHKVDRFCCPFSITPHNLEVSDIQIDVC